MAMGKRKWRQQPMWIASEELPRSRGHVFYDRVNEILKSEKFDEFAEEESVSFYKSENARAAEHRITYLLQMGARGDRSSRA